MVQSLLLSLSVNICKFDVDPLFSFVVATSSVSLTNTTTAYSQPGTTVPEAANEVTIGAGNNTDDPIVLSSDSEFESK